MSKLIGIFGGTFDPIHQGHLASLDLLCEQIDFARVHWVLSARPPHKGQTSASIEHRFAMLQLALAKKTTYVADDTEIVRQAKSYTIDTIKTFERTYPNDKLCLIIGGDSLLKLHSWHRYEALLDRVSWVVMHRPGYPLEVPEELQSRIVATPQELAVTPGSMLLFKQSDFNVSSTWLRAELAKPEGHQAALVKQFMPSAVINYIRKQQLYKIETMNPEQVKDQVVDALENIKAQNVKVIDIADISDFADYMVVASGTSDTHVKALAREASDSLRAQGVKPLNEDGADVGEWVLVDFGDVVLHVMRPEVREYYDLEKLWDEDVRNMLKVHREKQED